MQYKQKFYKISFQRTVKHLQNAVNNDHPTANKRKHILEFFDTYGLCATLDAFGICKSTLYKWQKHYKDNGARGLIALSKAPLQRRQSSVDKNIIDFILQYRQESQEVIKPHLDKYCTLYNICPISVATRGRMIKKLKE
jgi:hypothetical protein